MRLKHFITFCLVLFAVGSLHQCASKKSTTMYYYSDQNNNGYSIRVSEISYKPIRAEESSSGNYDGGEAKTASLTPLQFNAIVVAADVLLSDKGMHSAKREMMTSILSKIQTKETSKRVILRKSKNRTAFEVLLKEALNSEQ